MKNFKEVLEYGICFIIITGTILIFIGLVFDYAYAHEYDVKAMDNFALNEEVKLVESHMIKHTHVAEIDGKEKAVEISEYIAMPVKVKIYGR